MIPPTHKKFFANLRIGEEQASPFDVVHGEFTILL
jgi:hypothetical protein